MQNQENLNNSQIEQAQPNHQVRSRQIITSFEARLAGKKTFAERVADNFTQTFGSMKFFVLNMAWFAGWVVWNLGVIPGLPVFDPYPFILLVTIVSLEAIILSTLVLISQNRDAKIAKLRAEVDLQITMISEQEVTKIISLLAMLLDKHGIDTKSDPEVQKMLRRVDPWEIEKKIAEQLKKQ